MQGATSQAFGASPVGDQLESCKGKRLTGGLSDYHKFQKLGEGSYGKVYLAKRLSDSRYVALKKVVFDNDDPGVDEGVPPSAIREVGLLRQLSANAYIVDFLEVVYENHGLYLVFEYLNYDLKQYSDSLMTGHLISLDNVRSYLEQVLRGVYACHRNRVLHRDLKPQNLLLDREGYLKIADFGLGRPFASTGPVQGVDFKSAAPELGKFVPRNPLPGQLPSGMYTEDVVTRWYRAPEIMLGETNYGTAIDVWSIGCIFAEMLTRWPLLPGDSNVDQAHRTWALLGSPTEEVWPGVSKLPAWTRELANAGHPKPNDIRLAIFRSAHFQSRQCYRFSPENPKANLAEEVRTKPNGESLPALHNLHVRLSDTGMDLLASMLEYDPAKRISVKDALLHPYFDNSVTDSTVPESK